MPQLAISPDGSMLAFVGERDRVEGLYLRRFAQLQALPLVTGPVSDPFFSPDGEWVGFFSIADRKLKKIPVAGGDRRGDLRHRHLLSSRRLMGRRWFHRVQPIRGGVDAIAARASCRWQAASPFRH